MGEGKVDESRGRRSSVSKEMKVSVREGKGRQGEGENVIVL